jgi:hypothetical protein
MNSRAQAAQIEVTTNLQELVRMKTPKQAMNMQAALRWIERTVKHPSRMGCVVAHDADVSLSTRVIRIVGIANSAQYNTSYSKWIAYDELRRVLAGEYNTGERTRTADSTGTAQGAAQAEATVTFDETQEAAQEAAQAAQSFDSVPGQHFMFPVLLRAASARMPDGNRLNIFLVGPAGTGKTTAARNLAQHMSLPFAAASSVSDKYELIGYQDAAGVYRGTEFRKIWQDGGVFLFDEITGSNEQAMLAFNAALANGFCAFPDATIERHKDCVIIAGDNVFGIPSAEFNARNKLDAATIDRFTRIEWPIDEALEQRFSINAKWLRIVRTVRQAVVAKGIQDSTITPRAVLKGDALIAAGLPLEMVARMTLQGALPDDEYASLMRGISL